MENIKKALVERFNNLLLRAEKELTTLELYDFYDKVISELDCLFDEPKEKFDNLENK